MLFSLIFRCQTFHFIWSVLPGWLRTQLPWRFLIIIKPSASMCYGYNHAWYKSLSDAGESTQEDCNWVPKWNDPSSTCSTKQALFKINPKEIVGIKINLLKHHLNTGNAAYSCIFNILRILAEKQPTAMLARIFKNRICVVQVRILSVNNVRATASSKVIKMMIILVKNGHRAIHTPVAHRLCGYVCWNCFSGHVCYVWSAKTEGPSGE